MDRSRFWILVACLFIKSFFDGLAGSNGIVLRRDLHQSLRGASVCITLMAFAGTVGSYIPAHLPWSALEALRACMGPLLCSAGFLAFTGLLYSDSLSWFMAATLFAEVAIWTPYVSALCQFTQGIEDIAGSASSLLTALSFLGSSLVSLLVVVLAETGAAGFLLALGATLLLIALSLWLGPLSCTLALPALPALPLTEDNQDNRVSWIEDCNLLEDCRLIEDCKDHNGPGPKTKPASCFEERESSAA